MHTQETEVLLLCTGKFCTSAAVPWSRLATECWWHPPRSTCYWLWRDKSSIPETSCSFSWQNCVQLEWKFSWRWRHSGLL